MPFQRNNPRPPLPARAVQTLPELGDPGPVRAVPQGIGPRISRRGLQFSLGSAPSRADFGFDVESRLSVLGAVLRVSLDLAHRWTPSPQLVNWTSQGRS